MLTSSSSVPRRSRLVMSLFIGVLALVLIGAVLFTQGSRSDLNAIRSVLEYEHSRISVMTESYDQQYPNADARYGIRSDGDNGQATITYGDEEVGVESLLIVEPQVNGRFVNLILEIKPEGSDYLLEGIVRPRGSEKVHGYIDSSGDFRTEE